MLGPLQVAQGECPLDIGPPKQRAVLGVLLLAQGRVVSVDRLIDAVWGEDAPASATASLQAYISNLRRALRDGSRESRLASPIIRQPPGYYLDLDPDDVDLVVFEAACVRAAAAVEAGDWAEALAETGAALALWRGTLLEDLGDEPWVAQDAARVRELHTDCLDHRATALLALGRVAQALAEVTRLRAADPLADRGCWLQMLTLHRAGRTAEALEVYTRHARVLDAELGLEPAPELRELQTAILRQAPELTAWPRTPEWTGAGEIPAPSVPPVAEPAAVGSAPKGALVGRRRELAMASDILADVTAGATRWLVVSGPPGIGKTRLAQEAVTRFGSDGGGVVWVNCPDEQATPPWWPMRQLVRALGADPDTVLEVPPHADPDTARFRVYERVQELLESLSQPVAVVIDDVQWADTASVSCLAYLAGALRERPMAVILTVRDGEWSPELARLLATVARGDRNRHIDVPALSREDVATLANQVADDAVTDAEAATLADRTGGNPFFVSEYARLPRSERVGAEIPRAVKSVLDRRLAGLDPAVLQVLRTAAIVGDAMDRGAVPVLAQATRLDIDTLADYLDEAADERIVVPARTGDGYAFAHGLLREHLIAGMPALRRQRLHAKVAEVLATAGAEDALTRRAQHLVAAQPLVEPDVVVAACRLAAEQATRRWSSDIAADWWQAALEAYDRLPASAQSDSERDALAGAMLEAHSRAGRGRLVLDTVERYLREALRASRPATVGRMASALLRTSGGWPWLAPGGDPGPLVAALERAVAVAETAPEAGARVLAALAVGHCYHPDASVAADYLDRAERLAASTGDPDVIADALMGRLITYSGVATFSRQTLEWVDRIDALEHNRSREDRVIAHSVATMAAMNLGEVESAQRHLRTGIAGSEELQLPVLRAQFRWMEAVLAVWRGDFAEAQHHHELAAHVHEQTELYEAGSGMVATASLQWERGGPPRLERPGGRVIGETGGNDMVALAHTALLTVDRDPGAPAEATARLLEWRRGAGRAHAWTTLGHAALLAHLACEHGLSEFAPALLAALEPFEDRIAVIGQVGVAGPVALATARLHALCGDRARALAALERAAALARRTGGEPTLLRCRLLACELTEPAGERRALAVGVAADADRIGMCGVADAARALA
ncbi:MAG: AAA family ATPase [Actinobacteria bacterium]|nr:AAA family ATPase [Actinomycetota bacterium]